MALFIHHIQSGLIVTAALYAFVVSTQINFHNHHFAHPMVARKSRSECLLWLSTHRQRCLRIAPHRSHAYYSEPVGDHQDPRFV